MPALLDVLRANISLEELTLKLCLPRWNSLIPPTPSICTLHLPHFKKLTLEGQVLDCAQVLQSLFHPPTTALQITVSPHALDGGSYTLNGDDFRHILPLLASGIRALPDTAVRELTIFWMGERQTFSVAFDTYVQVGEEKVYVYFQFRLPALDQ